MIKRLCRLVQSGLISSTTFDGELGLPTSNHKIKYTIIMDLILNDWKHLIRIETTPKSTLRTFYYNNKYIYSILQSIARNTTNQYNKAFKFISWPNFLEGHHITCQWVPGIFFQISILVPFAVA